MAKLVTSSISDCTRLEQLKIAADCVINFQFKYHAINIQPQSIITVNQSFYVNRHIFYDDTCF